MKWIGQLPSSYTLGFHNQSKEFRRNPEFFRKELTLPVFESLVTCFNLQFLKNVCNVDRLTFTTVLFLVPVFKGAVALYPFSGVSKGRDISRNKNPKAILSGVRFVSGPDNHPKSAILFTGKRYSYVTIPNTGCLDTEQSITIMMWVYPERPGPLFHYNPKGWAVHFWLTRTNELFVRFVGRKRKNVPHVTSRSITPRAWNFVTATYNGRNGLATLWRSAVPIAQRNVGKLRFGLDTNHPIVIGVKPGDSRRFKGRISCVQVFRWAMNRAQIKARMLACWRKREYHKRFFR